ncbi:MAG: hypothetical protein GY809_14325 [Planctomycetes bacterium]|nr:hypothetical protein [Planctomycetota bacterium]
MRKDKKRAGKVCVHSMVIVLMCAGLALADFAESISKFEIDQGTLDSVQATFGVPLRGSWGNEAISLLAAPHTSDYCLHYSNRFVVRMKYASVMELRIQSPNLGYVWQESVVIGSNVEDVFSAAGTPDVIVEGRPNGGLAGVFFQDIDGRPGDCYYYCPDKHVRFYFSNYRVSAVHVMRSDYDSMFGAAMLDDLAPYQDVRWLESSPVIDVNGEMLKSLTFNSHSRWSQETALHAQDVMAAAKTPGLGVDGLHRKGVTGHGVAIGVIGEALLLDHEEYDGKITEYHNPLNVRAHNDRGAAVLSLVVGQSIGTAPEANVHYAACRDGVYEVDYVRSLYWLIQKNETLADSEKIRVVAAAAAPGEEGIPSPPGAYLNWRTACAAAEEAGIVVLDATQYRRLFDACWYDLAEPDRLESCTPGYPGVKGRFNDEYLLVPTSQRTVAEQYESGVSTYQYLGRHGMSWSTPYAAGVLAMGWQVAPDMSGPQMVEALLASAYEHEDLVQIIHPQRFIHSVGAEPAVYYVDLSATGDLDGGSWHNAYHDLQDALARTVYGDMIMVAEGRYLADRGTEDRQATFTLQKGVSIVGGYPAGGGEQNAQTHVTVLSGDLLQNDDAESLETLFDNSLHVVTASYTDAHTRLEGVTVTAGYTQDEVGAGLFAIRGDLTVENCLFKGNRAYSGGALGLLLSDPSISSSQFLGNVAEDLGGAILNDQHSSPTLTHCILSENRSGALGGAMANCDYGCDPIVIQCTVANNAAQIKAGGIYSWAGSPTLTHCILWGNQDAAGQDESSQLQHEAGSRPVINYCCIQEWSGLWKGQGNFSEAPLFADPGAHDYHLKSESGRWNDEAQAWGQDAETSPCIDAGDPQLDCSMEPDLNSQRLNLGAFGGSTHASLS